MPAYTEIDIILGCQQQQAYFQELLYKAYSGLLLKICARYITNLEEAEMVMHDGLLKIFKSINLYENKGSFEGWMKRIMVNTCLDYIKSKDQKQLRSTTNIEDFSIHDTFTINYESALDKISLKELFNLIHTLPTMSKTVFNMYIFDGLSHKEIAEMMQISVGTSQWHVNNARKLLQIAISKNNKG